MPLRFRLLPMLFAMLALLGGASAHAAAELCSDGPAIVRAAYPDAPKPDENFRVALPSGDFIWARQRDEFD